MACACGCNQTPGPGKRFVHGHSFHVINAKMTREERQARGRRTAASRSRDEWAEWGSKGGRTSHVRKWADLIERWQGMGPRQALREAYAMGYHAGYQAIPRVRQQKQKASQAA